MAAGDLITRAYQYEYAGVLYGSHTPAGGATPHAELKVESLDGLHSMPDLATSDLSRQDRHGIVAGNDLMGGRKIAMAFDIIVETAAMQADMESTLLALQKSLKPLPAFATLPWVFQRPGGPKKVLYARPRRRSVTSDFEMAHGLGKGTVEWIAPDPRIYELAVSTLANNILAGAANHQVVVATTGDYSTYPTFTITGPATNPVITVSGQTAMDDGQVYNNRAIRLNVVLAGGDTMVIDTKARTVTVNGVSHYEYVRTDNEWWMLVPGNNTVQYSRTGTPGQSNMTIAWQNAWQ